MRERERDGEWVSKGGEYVKERVERLLPVPCVCFLCCFRLFFTHRHAPPLGTHWKEFSPSLSRGRSSKSHRRTEVWSRVVVMMMMIEGVVCALLCARAQLCTTALSPRWRGCREEEEEE